MNCYQLIILSLAGMLIHSSVASMNRRRSVAYRPWRPNDVPACGLFAGAPQRDDCDAAYKSINVDDGGNFLTDDSKPAPDIKKKYNTCTVRIYTSDRTILYASKTNVDKPFADLLAKCNGQSGEVLVAGGTSSVGGHTIVDISGQK